MPTERPSTLFVFAHPDDEFFCIPFIADAVREGHEVHCVYLTDGAWGGQSAERRMDETRRVLGRYGVPSGNAHFIGARLGIPDGQLHLHLARAYDALLAFPETPPARIYTMAWEGGHQDHDAAYALTIRLVEERRIPEAFQFALYNAFRCARPWFRVMKPLDANGPVERRKIGLATMVDMACNAFRYPSQWKTWMALLPFATLRLLTTRSVERQRLSRRRLDEAPHAGPLLYERRGNARFIDLKSCIDAFMASHS